MMRRADNRRITTFPGRASAYLGCVALLLVVAGSSACGGDVGMDPFDPGSTSGSGLASESLLPTDCPSEFTDCNITWAKTALVACPSGTCDPGSPNGKGIYVDKDNNYCLVDSLGRSRFCPEAFINLSTSVLLELRDVTNSRFIYQSKVEATLVDAWGVEQPVNLQSIRSDKTRLDITYMKADGSLVTVTGTAVSSLRLKFRVTVQTWSGQELHPYEMKLQLGSSGDSTLPPGFHRYVVFYRAQGSVAAWYPQCPSARGPRLSSFLGGKRVDGLTAEAVTKPEAVSFGCETGAIDSCLAWGYTPWNPRPGDLSRSDYLFRSCLQAKRAAYFIGHGDPTSYTVAGTEILKRDQYGINAQTMDRLEAIWTPRGAYCLNPGNRRRPELALPDSPVLEPCPSSWPSSAKLATGPVSTPLSAP